MIDGSTIILLEAGLVEVEKDLALAITVSVNLRVGDVGTKDGVGDGARSGAECLGIVGT